MVQIVTRRTSSYQRLCTGRCRHTRTLMVVVILAAITIFLYFESHPPVSTQSNTNAVINTVAGSKHVQDGLTIAGKTREFGDKMTPRILYYNRHSACHANMLQITSRLNLTFKTLNPGFLGGLGMDGDKANSCINDGFVRTVCETADIIIVADTMPDARPLFQSLVRESEAERCKANIVLELTTRFDWGIPDQFEYYKLNWKLAHRAPKNLFWVTNNAFEPLDLAYETLATPKFRMLRPTGHTELQEQNVPEADRKLALCREEEDSAIFVLMRKMKIPFKHVSGGYGGPKTLAKYRAFIEIPYQVSTMKLYENLAAGVVMLFPSHEFFRELVEKDLHSFGPWDKISRAGDDWYKYMDYYAPEISPYVYYFNSFEHLKALLTSDAVLDTKNVREGAPRAYKKLVKKMLHGWADLYGEMGYKVTVDGEKHIQGSGVDISTAPLYDSKAKRPKSEDDWEREFKRLQLWQDMNRQARVNQARKIRKNLSDLEMDSYVISLGKKSPEHKQFATLPYEFDDMDTSLVKLLDFLNGELTAGGDVFGGSLTSSDGKDVAEWMGKTADLIKSVAPNMKFGPSNYGAISKLHRAFHLMDRIMSDKEKGALSAPGKELLSALAGREEQIADQMKVLQKVLFSWAFSNRFSNLQNLLDSFNQERGIVLSVGNGMFEQSLLIIQHIRKNLNCDLPVEVFYNGLQDLELEKINGLKKMRKVTVKNLQEVFSGIAEDRNFHSKPFAILASSFKEVIYVDDDVVLFKNPNEILTDSKLFKKFGVLFFKGLSYEFGNSQWTRWFIKTPSAYANRTSRYFKDISKDEMDASLMLFDKGRVDIVHGLLSTCHLNLREVREGGLDKHLQGDKETYWLGLELLRIPYQFVPGVAGVAGSLQVKNGVALKNSVCGPQSHLDEFGKLLHVNTRSARFNNQLEIWEKKLSHYISPLSENPGNIDSTVQPWCVSGDDTAHEKEVFAVSASEKDTVMKLREVEMEIRHESWHHFLDNHV